MTSQKRTPRNSCTRYQPLIDMMIDGELEQGRVSGLQDHMRDCPKCRRVRKDLLSIRSMASSPEDLDLDCEFVSRVKETLFDSSYTVEKKEVSPLPQVPRRKTREPQMANVAVYAAMLMIGCFFAFGAYRFGRIHESQNVEGPEQARLTAGEDSRDADDALASNKDALPARSPLVVVDDDEFALEVMNKSDSEVADKGTPFLNAAIKKTQEAINVAEADAEAASYEFEDQDETEFSDEIIPTEDVVLSSMARNVLTSCDQMEAIHKEVSAKMPTVEGGILHATPLVMNVTETTIDLQQLLKKGMLMPGSKLITADKMNIVFEIEGNGVHLRIEVDNLNDKAPRVNVVDLTKESKSSKRRSRKKPAVKKLKLR
jgi:hypothetical protein